MRISDWSSDVCSSDLWPSPTVIVTVGALVAMACSIAGNEWAERFGRRSMVILYLLSSAAMALVVGFLPGLPYTRVESLILVSSGLVPLDLPQRTSAAVAASEPGRLVAP